MTQQYIVGEFSSLLAGLQPAPDEVLGDAVGNLRHEVEFGPLPMLPRLAQEALNLTDMSSMGTRRAFAATSAPPSRFETSRWMRVSYPGAPPSDECLEGALGGRHTSVLAAYSA